jgi:hypothetical protein
MPGQTGEQLTETCSNLPEVIWAGANGELIDPEFIYKFSAEATMHYTGGTESKYLEIPDEAKANVKLCQYCIGDDDSYHFPPHANDEVGVVLGLGDTIEDAISQLKYNFELLENEPLSINFEGFAELLKSVQAAEEQGLQFTTQEVPDPESILKI